VWQYFHDTFVPHETWAERMKRAKDAEIELKNVKAILSAILTPKQISQLESRLRKKDCEPIPVIAN
ncbi:MAG: hypothetical protein JRN15_15165, partial [Nitrososphaerota archaeon]|nr:hypothetical protein [Nitrososphaerota archaeon]